MVEEIKYYECEVCRIRYDTLSEAKRCETKKKVELYPIGMIFTMDDLSMVFAIIKQHPNQLGHHHAYSTWACRDTSVGDNVGSDKYCGIKSWDIIYPPNKKNPAYKRMVKALKKVNIEISDYKRDELWKMKKLLR